MREITFRGRLSFSCNILERGLGDTLLSRPQRGAEIRAKPDTSGRAALSHPSIHKGDLRSVPAQACVEGRRIPVCWFVGGVSKEVEGSNLLCLCRFFLASFHSPKTLVELLSFSEERLTQGDTHTHSSSDCPASLLEPSLFSCLCE